ncbi:MAG: hypothetical protein H7A51_13465 [Akkermansiaceae bacterium]|nr:hypothetical protein [Akkermansiaceae bacterium]
MSIHKGLFVLLFLLGASFVYTGYDKYSQGKIAIGLLGLLTGTWYLYRATRSYKHTWDITKEGSKCRIIVDREELFYGTSDDLSEVREDSQCFYIYPIEGNGIAIPKSVANNHIIELFRAKKSVEQVAASDR